MPLEILRSGKLSLKLIVNNSTIIFLSLEFRQGRIHQGKRLQQHSTRHLRVFFQILAKHARKRIGYYIIAATGVLKLEFRRAQTQNPSAHTAYILGFSQ
jgi:hypothetical protein